MGKIEERSERIKWLLKFLNQTQKVELFRLYENMMDSAMIEKGMEFSDAQTDKLALDFMKPYYEELPLHAQLTYDDILQDIEERQITQASDPSFDIMEYASDGALFGFNDLESERVDFVKNAINGIFFGFPDPDSEKNDPANAQSEYDEGIAECQDFESGLDVAGCKFDFVEYASNGILFGFPDPDSEKNDPANAQSEQDIAKHKINFVEYASKGILFGFTDPDSEKDDRGLIF